MVVDANGTAGYPAGEDLLFQMGGAANLDGLTIATFI